MKVNFNHNRYHPTDLIHGLLATHCGNETGDKPDSDIKNKKSVEFTDKSFHLNQLFLNEKDISLNELVKDWLIEEVVEDKQTGYLGIIYINHQNSHIVLAHRSTNFALSFKHNMFKQSGAQADFQGILKGPLTSHQECGYNMCDNFLQVAKRYPDYSLSVTGHSLGAWLAEMTVFYSQIIPEPELQNKVKAISFDGPGSYEMMKQLSKPSIKGGSILDVKNLDITAYFSAPNLVNCANRHVGDCYRLFPRINDEFRGLARIFAKIYGKDELESTYGHKMEYILPHFNIKTGKPDDFTKVISWPSITHDTYILHAKEQNTLTSVLSMFESYFKGDIDLSMFWEVHKHINREYGYSGLVGSNQFKLRFGAGYDVIEVDFKKKLVSDHIDHYLLRLLDIKLLTTKMKLQSSNSNNVALINELTSKYKMHKDPKTRDKYIEVKEQDFSIYDLRDKARDFIHKHGKKIAEFEKLLVSALDIVKEKGKTLEIVEYLSYLQPDTKIKSDFFENLFDELSIKNARTKINDGLNIETEAGVILIPDLIHKNVQNYFLSKSNGKGNLQIVKGLFLKLIDKMSNLTDEPRASWKQAIEYFPHIKYILNFVNKENLLTDDESLKLGAKLSSKLGAYYRYIENEYKMALVCFKSALDREGMLDQFEISNIYQNISWLSMITGDYNKAYECIQKAISISNNEILKIFKAELDIKLGKIDLARTELDNIDTKNLDDTGIILYHEIIALVDIVKGNLPEALAQQERIVLAVNKETNHALYSKCYNNLGVIYLKMDRYLDAKDQFLKSLSIKEKFNAASGKQANKWILEYLTNTIIALSYSGNLQDINNYEKEYSIIKDQILDTYSEYELNLLQIRQLTFHNKCNLFKKSQEVFKEVISCISKNTLTLDSLYINKYLASVYYQSGFKEDALKALQQHKICLKTFYAENKNNLDYIKLYKTKALYYANEEKYDDAVGLLVKALGLANTTNLLDQQIEIHNNLGVIYQRQQYFDMALSEKKQALEIANSMEGDCKYLQIIENSISYLEQLQDVNIIGDDLSAT